MNTVNAAGDTGILFSIVIPCYNYAQVLPRALDSALAQGGADYEVIAINDGSTDTTRDVLDRYAAAHADRLRVIHQDNRGLAAVRNRGAREARGNYLVYLDADDEAMPDALAQLRVVLARDVRPAMIIGGHWAIHESGRHKLHPQPPLPPQREQCFARYIHKQIALSNGAVAMRRDAVLDNPYPETVRHGEDIPVFALLLARYDCMAIDVPLARIHKHRGSMRHDVAAAKRTNLQLVEILFDSGRLPVELQHFRAEFLGRRCLSLFRTCHRAGDHAAALAFYRSALGYQPRLALQPTNLIKALRSLWGRLLG